jgi:cytochrome c oxidase assembly protein subunit 11
MFTSEVDPELDWDFEPIQRTLEINAGEPALMFYKVRNNGTKPVVGISLYSMFPEDTGWYFSKIQCFCFNQQLVAPGEEINLPLYFYLEPEIVEDPYLSSTKDITVIFLRLKNRLSINFTQRRIKTWQNGSRTRATGNTSRKNILGRRESRKGQNRAPMLMI